MTSGSDLTQADRQRLFDEIQRKARIAAIWPAISSGIASSIASFGSVFLFFEGLAVYLFVLPFVALFVILTWKGMYERAIDKGLVEAGLEDADILDYEDPNDFS